MELFKTAATYAIAMVIIVGGGALLVIPTQIEHDALLPFLTGAIGTVLGYVFAERQTAQAQKGNGLEQERLEAAHRRIDQVIASTPAVPGAVSAEKIAVEGEQVTVTGPRDGPGG